MAETKNGNGWKSRKVVLTVIALVGVAVGFVYGFIYGDGAVILAALAALGFVTGLYNLTNAWQSRAYASKDIYNEEDEGQGRA